MASFEELGLPEEVMRSLRGAGITEPFPIQAAALPDALAGRDLLGRGRTGSGKTIAFGIPAVIRLSRSRTSHNVSGSPRGLILVPTRELAAQVAAVVKPLGSAMGLRTGTVFGGVSQGPQVTALRRGIDIVVATPGRLEDLIAQGHCHLDQVDFVVLDEADHMADLGFLPVVKRILDQVKPDSQHLLFSATLDQGIESLANRYLNDPVTHSVDVADATPPDLDHLLFVVAQGEKAAVLSELAAGQERTLFFTRTKHGARKLARTLTAAGIPALDLQGNLSQNVRTRNLADFTSGNVRVLVATDIAARGIHVDDIALVVHVDPPEDHKAYLHRSGRTARAGASGVVVTMATPEQLSEVKTLVRRAGVQATRLDVVQGDDRISELTGPPAARVQPRPLAPVAAPQARPNGGRGRGPGPRSAAGRARRPASAPSRNADRSRRRSA